MNIKIFKNFVNSPIKDRTGPALIVLSSFLLGIWATVHTIALRNILLGICTILSIIYLKGFLKDRPHLLFTTRLRRSDLLRWLPSALIAAMFVWVMAHYIFFAQFPEKQWDELTSTWLRAFLGSIIGFGCALALQRNPSYAWLLWVGLIVSFLVLIYQYIPKALVNRSLFATDFFGNYIYWAKFSGVLAGIILFAGALGLAIDNARISLASALPRLSGSFRLHKAILFWVIVLGILLPIYAFVFIFSAKNGVGTAVILLIFWFVVGGIYFLISFYKRGCDQSFGKQWIGWGMGYFLIACIFLGFAYQHVKSNPGWEGLIEDIRIAVQIEKYHHWQDPKHGFPKRADGSSVAGNTYERASLATVGLTMILDNPLGNGVFRSLPSQMHQGGIKYDHYVYTHSAWVDLGLSFGWPGLLLLPSALLICLLLCIKKYRGVYRCTVASLAVSLLILYLVGEYAFQHGIEILLFVCALTAGICGFQESAPQALGGTADARAQEHKPS